MKDQEVGWSLGAMLNATGAMEMIHSQNDNNNNNNSSPHLKAIIYSLICFCILIIIAAIFSFILAMKRRKETSNEGTTNRIDPIMINMVNV